MAWFQRYHEVDEPDLRLFCFPHAGGGPHAYRSWADTDAPLENIEVVCVNPPGRGSRASENPVQEMAVYVDAVINSMGMFFDRPFGFFGHSLGSLLVYEVALELRRRALPTPIFLAVSANTAPQMHTPDEVGEVGEGLSATDFVDKVGRGWGFIPKAAMENAELLDIMMPPLQADLQMWAKYRIHPDALGNKLSMPVLALGGTADNTLDAIGLDGWAEVTLGKFQREVFDGGHFYLDGARDAVLVLLNQFIHQIIADLPLAVILGDRPARPEFELCVHEIFERQVEKTPDQLALVGIDQSYTYRELDAAATLLARRLQQLGVCAAVPVGVFLPHSEQYVIANLGIFKAGGSMFLIETNFTPQLIADFLLDCNLAVVLTFAEMKGNLPKESAQGTPYMVVEMDGTGWVTEAEADLALPILSPHGLSPTDPAYHTMTSGTTGKPKAVINSHYGSVICFVGRNDLYPYLPEEREGLNMFFAWECVRAVMFGSTSVIIPDSLIFDPPKLMRYLREQRITRLMTTPSLLATILNTRGIDFPRYLDLAKYWWLEGEVVPLRLVDRFVKAAPKCSLVNLYSSWEALDTAHANLTDDRFIVSNRQSLIAPVGAVMPQVQVYVCDDEMRLLRLNQPGNLFVGTPAMFLGYLNDQVKTAEKLLDNPWAPYQNNPMLGGPGYLHSAKVYRTGDRARVRPDGQLEILGRADSTVKIRAFKVGLGMVENSIAELAGVGSAVVSTVLDESTKQPTNLVAYIVGDKGIPTVDDLRALRLLLAARLPDYAVPVYWYPLAQFPQKKGESRKLDRGALPPPGREHDLSKGNPKTKKPSIQPILQTADESSVGAMETEMLQIFKSVLGTDDLLPSDNFFEMGGHSLMAATLVGQLNELGLTVAIVDLYQHPSVEALATRVLGATTALSQSLLVSRAPKRSQFGGPIAVVGIAGEFPRAPNVQRLWANLRDGVDAIRKIQPDEYAARGFPEHLWKCDDWTPAAYAIDNADKFDASFFGIGPREAVIMDPQHRRFMQCAWESLEAAGYAPKAGSPTRTAVFAAAGIDGYMHHHFDGTPLKDFGNPGLVFLGEVGSEKDYIATRVSYAIDGTGPSMNVNSACSSGLVAVAQAVRALQAGDCDMAVAGAASLSFPNLGYMYGEGLTGSHDGRVRPFDADASGTVFGDSVASVVLKRLDEAIADGDFVWGVVTGAAVTNDGRQKAAYAAPSARAQATAVSDALAEAQRSPSDISYIECHATATLLGDGIELSGLADAFAEAVDGSVDPWCALGSIKGNIGHANCAAGMTGFIKTLLCLHHKELVPTIHYETANPKLALDDPSRAPFFINKKRGAWNPSPSAPHLIAGVSSFGIGGTNCHLILEQPTAAIVPAIPVPSRVSGRTRTSHLLTFSAKSVPALRNVLLKMATYLTETANTVQLSTVADVLHRGRESFPFRIYVVADTPLEAATKIGDAAAELSTDMPAAKKNPRVIFMFPGQGSHYLNMARKLHAEDPVFRRHFDACADTALPLIGSLDIREVLTSNDASLLDNPCAVQLAIFATEYAMAKLLMHCGVRPTALAGHSIGEYAASVIGGILPLHVALRMIAVRAATVRDACPRGGMLTAPLSPAEADAFATDFNARHLPVDAAHQLSVAAYNGISHVVFSGPLDVCKQAEVELCARKLKVRQLHVTNAFHSPSLQPAATAVAAVVKSLQGDDIPAKGVIPVTSNVTGEWMSEEVKGGDYWAEQIVGPVHWTQNVAALMRWHPECFVEVGPGNTLGFFVNTTLSATKADGTVFSTMRHAKDTEMDDVCAVLSALGGLWSRGVVIDWDSFHENSLQARDPFMPTYAWDEQSFWQAPERSIYVDPPQLSANSGQVQTTRVEVDWLVRYARPHAMPVDTRDVPILLYCFPYAGGSSRVFETWAIRKSTPPWLDIVAVEPAQRGVRADEETRRSSIEEIEIITILIRAELDAHPEALWALCGFSKGALAAVEVAAMLTRDGYGHRLATMAIAGRALPVDEGSNTEYDLDTLNLAPESVRESAEWETTFKPMLLRDLSDDSDAARRISQLSESGDLTGMITSDLLVFFGESDTSFTPVEAEAWGLIQSQTSSTLSPPILRHQGFADGHGFLDTFSNDMCDAVTAVLGRHQPPGGEILHSVQWTPCGPTVNVSARPPLTKDSTKHALECVFWSLAQTTPRGFSTLGTTTADPARLSECLGGPCGLVLVLESGTDISAATDECWRFAELLQAISAADLSGHIMLLCPTEAPAALTLGLSKAAALEMPEVQFQRVFVPPGDSEDSLRRAVGLALEHRDEHDLWLRVTGRRDRQKLTVLTQRIIPETSLSLEKSTSAMSQIGTYVVTGGTGGVGTAVITWLIEVCAVPPAHIIALCRNPGSHGARQLAANGVSILQLDCSDPVAVRDCTNLGDLTNVVGVFHLAGVLEDTLVTNLTRSALTKVVAPKAAGALALLTRAETLGWDLDFWVNFSSSSSLLGYAGQSNYCAANSVLDHLAMFPSADARSPPMLTINWGPWGEAGMAAPGTKAYSQAIAEGDRPLSNTTALAHLGQALSAFESSQASGRQFLITDVDWSRSPWASSTVVPQGQPQSAPSQSVKSVSPGIRSDVQSMPDDNASAVAGMSPDVSTTTRTSIVDLLKQMVPTWNTKVTLPEAGLDSLDVVQIRNAVMKELHIKVPLSVFNKPNQTLGGLVDVLEKAASV